MSKKPPHYLLFSDHATPDDDSAGGHWHFALESLDGDECIDASASEPEICGERLELLAVVRGLEALNQPSRVTLVTPSRYVSRGIRFGLDEWRTSGWKWERHGWMVPVKNADLWQRVDRAMEYHDVQCRRWRVDQAHGLTGPRAAMTAIIDREEESLANQAGGQEPARAPSMGAARSIIRTLRDGVAAAMQSGDPRRDFGMPNWSLAR